MEAAAKGSKHKSFTVRIPAKAGAWYVVSGAVARGVSFFGTPIFTRLLTPQEYGLFPLFSSWLVTLTSLCTLELTGNALHRGIQKYKGEEDRLVGSTLSLILLLLLGICALYFTFFSFSQGITGLSLGTSVLLFLGIFCGAVVNLYSSKCRYEYKYKTVAVTNIAFAILTPAISILVELFPVRAA